MKKYLLSISIVSLIFSQVYAENIFKDIDDLNVNKDAIEFTKSIGIVGGYDDGTFKPDNKINRAEFLKIALKATKDFNEKEALDCIKVIKSKGYRYVYLKDVPLNTWYAKYVCLAYENEIIKGYPDNTFKASNDIGFSEMAKIIVNTQGWPIKDVGVGEEWYISYVKLLSNKNAIPASIKKIDQKVTRGEMTESVYRVIKNIENKSSSKLDDLLSSDIALDNGIRNDVEKGKMGDVRSCERLGDIMRSSSDYNNEGISYSMGAGRLVDSVMMMRDAKSVEGAASTQEATPGSNDYSQTNIQVKGVDESDMVKNDGKYIYMIKGNNVRIIDAYPASIMKEVSKIDLFSTSFIPSQLYLSENKLIIIGNDWRNDIGKPAENELRKISIMPRYWGTNLVKVFIVDTSDKSKPIIERKLSFEGNYSQSRRVGNYVYLVMNKFPDYHILRELKASEQNIIPFMSDSLSKNSQEKPISGCADIRFFPGYERPNYLIISSISITNKEEEVKSEVFLGASENIYMSAKSLYVVTGVNDFKTGFWNNSNTQIYKFAVQEGKVEFKVTKEVPGRILNQFSMDEYNGSFRIVTTEDKNTSTGFTTSNNLFTLSDSLSVLGKIENIANSERIKSVRFMGDRAFMVTFKNIDPFFVIDLIDPNNPKILGELKIPGWSDYLHPYDKNHLIGFGREVDQKAVEKGGVFTFNDTLGLKISIFDISDLSNPKEKFKTVIGTRGTESQILHEHRALLFDASKNLLAIPIEVKEKESQGEINCYNFKYDTCPSVCTQRCTPTSCSANGSCTSDCGGPGSCVFKYDYEQIKTTFAGAMVFDISVENGIKEKGRISNYSKEDYNQQYFFETNEKMIHRIIYIGENLYTISYDIIKAASMSDVREINSVKLGGESSSSVSPIRIR